jgi:ATP-dependent Clp protease ATP-binding subunit ClpA
MAMPSRPYLTTRASTVLSLAHDLADRLGHDDVTPVHVALGLLQEGHGIGVYALHSLGVPLDTLERELETHLPPPGTPRPAPAEREWSPADERLLAQAVFEAEELGTVYHGCYHLLLGILRDESTAPARVLARHGVGFAALSSEIRRIRTAETGGAPAPPPPA